MYSRLFIICFFAITSLAADQEDAVSILQETNLSVEECSSTPTGQTVSLKQKPNFCCVSYLPSNEEECSGGYLYGDFLFWYANEDNLSPCMTVKGVSNAVNVLGAPESILAGVKTNHMPTKWDPGFRVGWGNLLSHDGWDIEANYTWYYNKKNHVFSVPSFGDSNFPNFPVNGQLGLLDPWINPDVLITYPSKFVYPEFDTVKSQWKFLLNQIDFVFGKELVLSCSMVMRAYAGARGAWLTTRFNNVASSKALFSSLFNTNTFSDRFRDRIWGGGLLAGLQPKWRFCDNFLLFSNLDAALLWGKCKVRKKEDYTSLSSSGATSLDFHSTSLNSFFKMQTIFDLSLGLQWEESWCNRLKTYLDLAWEQHIWFDVSHRVKLNSFSTNIVTHITSGFQNYDELQGNLMMGGAIFRFRVDF